MNWLDNNQNYRTKSTGRFGMELGYNVTLVKDATAGESWEEMHAAELNGPTFAHTIVSTTEIVAALAEQTEFRGESVRGEVIGDIK